MIDSARRAGELRPDNSRTGRPSVHFRAGFTLVELMVVVAVIALVAVIAIPNFTKARTSSQVKACIKNLKILEDAKKLWALENRRTRPTDRPTNAQIRAYLRQNRMPICPAQGTYTVRQMSISPTCSRSAIGHNLGNINMDDDPDPD